MADFDNNQFDAFETSQFSYYLDICIVMDITGSMASKIKMVKENSLNMYNLIKEKMESYKKNVDKVRVKILGFRDFAYGGDKTIEESRFFELPEEAEELKAFAETLKAEGGGDAPESALEAIALAMRSDWTPTDTTNGTKARHVILVYTDAPAVPLNDSSKPERCVCARIENPTYPANMPKTMAELSDMWDGISQELPGMPDQKAKRFILFAPDAEPWNSMIWDNTWYNECRCDHILSEVEMDMVITIIGKCI